MSKRTRDSADQEVFESFASLLRQSASRAMERIKLHRARSARDSSNAMSSATATASPNSGGGGGGGNYNFPRAAAAGGADNPRMSQASGGGGLSSSSPSSQSSLKPIDSLVIQYTMFYLNLSAVPANHYVRLTQEVVTASPDRVLQPRFFTKAGLPQLCEALVAENTAAAMEDALRDVGEFVDAREIIGDWIAERTDGIMMGGGNGNDNYYTHGGGGYDEDEAYGDEDRRDTSGHGANRVNALDLAALLYASLEFWLRVQGYIHSLSLGAAKADAFRLRPRYEQELLRLLNGLASSGADAGGGGGGSIKGGKDDRIKNTEKNDNNGSREDALYAEELTSAKAEPTTTGAAAVVVKTEPSLDGSGEEGGLDVSAMLAAARAAADKDGDDDDDDEEEKDESAPVKVGSTSSPGDSTTAVQQQQQQQQQRRQHRRDLATAVLADALALSHCKGGLSAPSPKPQNEATNDLRDGGGGGAAASSPVLTVSEALRQRSRGVEPRYYAMIHARLGVMVARDRLRQFSTSSPAAAAPPPALAVAQRNILERAEADRLAAATAAAAAATANSYDRDRDSNSSTAAGLPADFVPDDRYYSQLLAQQHISLSEGEEIYKDEVVDYYLHRRRQQERAAKELADRRAAGSARREVNRAQQALDRQEQKATQLIKPHRLITVYNGYTWSQYNRTHYDSRTNPPPKTPMWYRFTLFYPELVNAKRDMRNIFRIEDTAKGPGDDYCMLVFSVGAPYEDVAFRIPRKQWDVRRGGVRISFDPTGKYQLFFRFASSNYRR